jgi:hypothetical protein
MLRLALAGVIAASLLWRDRADASRSRRRANSTPGHSIPTQPA